MAKQILHIKNMVCPRCIESVKNLLEDNNIAYEDIELGKVTINTTLSPKILPVLEKQLKDRGFELIRDKNQMIVDKIKTEIIKLIHYDEGEGERVNISGYLSKILGYEYSYLSKLFSSHEDITIEKYVIRQKIERVKELLLYDELSLKEITWKLGYSSTQHLSGQFKKITGLNPSAFKKLQSIERKSLHEV